MGIGLYNLLFNYKIDPVWFENELPIAIESLVKIMEANCGVIVLLSKDGESFQEYASYGYGDDGFFYTFLSRGEGHFEKMAESILPLFFSSRDFSMFYDYTDYCIVSRVFSNRMIGFLLFEFTGEYKELNSVVVAMFADKLAKVTELVNGNHSVYQKGLESESGVVEILIESSPSLKVELEVKSERKVLYIKGESGSGKKTISKKIYKNLSLNGDFIVINSIPDQLLKLEKSLYEWCSMVGNGIIVFQGLGDYSISQQRLFYELLLNTDIQTRFHFIQDKKEPDEVYKPFFKLIEENSILVPGLNSLSEDILHKIVYTMFDDILLGIGRQGLRLSKEALSVLSNYYYTHNLKELRNILEHTILKVKSDIIQKDELEIRNEGDLKEVGALDVEDLNLRRCLDALERQKILLANKLFAGNQVRMAKALGISRGSLQYKMKHMEL